MIYSNNESTKTLRDNQSCDILYADLSHFDSVKKGYYEL